MSPLTKNRKHKESDTLQYIEYYCLHTGEQESPDDSYYGGSGNEENSSANAHNAYASMTNDADDDY